jgi:hypothetical protein
MKKLIVLLLFLVICGCGKDIEYRYFNGHLEDLSATKPYIGTFQRRESRNTLLEFYSFSGGFPIPTFGGYSLFIEGPAISFQPNTEIKIPNENVKVTYYHDYHHIGSLEKNFVGSIKIKESTDNFITAIIDVTNKDTDKKFEIKGKFQRVSISKYNRVER